MAEQPPPIRPQRGVSGSVSRSTRETTGGLLMSVIRSLSTSRDLADRDRERSELEKGFAQCDKKLNELVSQHNNDLYTVMNTFSKILNNLGRSKEKLLDTREKLQNCQKLLHCKRDELKKLWLESVENKAVLDLLERVETVSSLPKQVDSFASKKYFLHAAQCCVDGLKQLGEETRNGTLQNSASSRSSMLKGPSRYGDAGYGVLSKIEALAEVRVELLAKKESLFESAIDELHRHLYLISSADVRKRFHRNGSFRSSSYATDGGGGGLGVPEQRSRKGSAIEIMTNTSDLKKLLQSSQSMADQSNREHNEQSSSNSLLLNSFLADNNNNNAYDNYPEEDSRQFISMLSKCLGLLNKIPDAIEVIKDRSDREFINVVIKTAQDVLITSGGGGGGASTIGSSSSASATRANSFLDISSMGSDSLNGTLISTEAALMSSGAMQHNQVVLTCTALLGHSYNGYSHLSSTTSGININDGSLQLNKSSLQLQDFFDMLMRQYRTIVSLHESIVLPNLERIELGLHSADLDNDLDNPKTVFYTSADLWARVQSLVQQLLDYYLDSSNLGGIGGINTNMNSLGSGSFHFLLSAASVGSPGAAVVSSASALPVDYSSYFSKRKVLAGAMNAMNAMTNKTMTAISTGAGGGGGSNAANHGESNSVGGQGQRDQTSTLPPGSTLSPNPQQHQHQQHANSGSSTGNFLSSFGGSAGRASNLSLFKFDHSNQAISWNAIMAEQQNQLHQQRLLSPKSNDDDGKDGKDGDGDSTHHGGASSASVTPSVISKLFETLRTISAPSPDNLVIIYGTLLKFAAQCPPFTDLDDQLDSRSVKSMSTLQSANINQGESSLQAYLMAAADKFSAHINVQLEKMLEMASKSLESGVTVSIAHMSPLTAALTIEENEAMSDAAVSKAQQNQAHFLQQQLNSKLYPPLLESAVLVDVSTRDLRALMQAMPDYSNVFLGYICNVLNTFKEACTGAYDGIVEPAGGAPIGLGLMASASSYDISSSHTQHNLGTERRIISANWAKDQDINRLLKSLPNWATLQEHQAHSSEISSLQSTTLLIPSVTKVSPVDARKRFNHQMSSFDESPEDIRLRNLRETEILTSNLSQEIPKHELLWQEGQFKQLGQLQESFEWMAARCDDLVNSIIALQQQADHPSAELYRNLPEVYIATLNQQAKDFADLAEICLLVMHLEVRIHCFFHLQSLDRNFFTTAAPHLESDGQGARAGQEHFSDDQKIIPLLDDLKRMYDELQRASLKPYKTVYVFEGLDHLITTIFLNSVTAVSRIKPNGVKRACRAIYDIQRRLSSITKTRELALDYARQYFELLLTTPDEILSNIIERGTQFQGSEYVTALTLLHQSGLVHGSGSSGGGGGSGGGGSATEAHITNADMERNLKRLRDILNEVSVTI